MTTLSPQDLELVEKYCTTVPEMADVGFLFEDLADLLAERDSIRDSVSQKQIDNLQSSIDFLTKRQAERDAQQLKECVWSEEDDENMPNTWNGDCGAMWTFTEGGVKDNSMHYCPECGGKVVIAELANRNGK